MKRYILFLIAVIPTAFAAAAGGETSLTGSDPKVALGPDGKAVCVFIRQGADNKSVICRVPLADETFGTPDVVTSAGLYRFEDLVIAQDNSNRILAVASMPRMMTRHGFTAAQSEYAYQPVVTCFEVRRKSVTSVDAPPEYFIVSVSPNPMLDLECASRNCALLADGNGSVLIIDSNGFLARSTAGKFWTLQNPERIYTADAVSVTIARSGDTYHVFYATAGAGGILELHHLASDNLDSWQDASVPEMPLESESELCAASFGGRLALVGTRKLENGERAVVVSTTGVDGAWSAPETVASGSAVTLSCDAACDAEGKLHVVYEEKFENGETVIRCLTREMK